jgi:hypothetical protein
MGHSEYDPGAKERPPMERRPEAWQQTRAEATAGLGHQILAGSRAAARDRAMFDLAIVLVIWGGDDWARAAEKDRGREPLDRPDAVVAQLRHFLATPSRSDVDGRLGAIGP